MSPQASALGYQSPDWAFDQTWPVKPIIPLYSGAGTAAQISAVSYQFGADGSATWTIGGEIGSHAGGGVADGETAGGVWAAVVRPTGATGNAGTGRRIAQWRPALDPVTCPPGEDDPDQRIAWFQLQLLEDPAQSTPAITDSLGYQILPDDGLNFGTGTWPVKATGGFGLFRRVGDNGYRWASYSGAGALLEATNLAGGTGWHSADLIIRQAVFGDAATPWLTLKWDGVTIIRERAFGHALLAAPQAVRASSHGWAIYYGLFPGDSGKMALRSRIRIGRFHPDGYVQP